MLLLPAIKEAQKEEMYLSRKFSNNTFLYYVVSYLISMAALVFLAYRFYYFVYEYLVIIYIIITLICYLPPVIIMNRREYPIKEVLRLNRFSFKHFIYTVGITVCSYLVMYMLLLLIYKIFNTVVAPDLYWSFSSSSYAFWPGILIVCLLPAFFEEITFRGIIQSGYYQVSPIKRCILIGVLFSLIHLSIPNLIPFAFLGFVFSFISIRANSIVPSMIAHFLINFISLTNVVDTVYLRLFNENNIAAPILILIISLGLAILLMRKMPQEIPTISNNNMFLLPDEETDESEFLYQENNHEEESIDEPPVKYENINHQNNTSMIIGATITALIIIALNGFSILYKLNYF